MEVAQWWAALSFGLALFRAEAAMPAIAPALNLIRP
jgi:hypothetical protein